MYRAMPANITQTEGYARQEQVLYITKQRAGLASHKEAARGQEVEPQGKDV